jgi:hypothetical protein
MRIAGANGLPENVTRATVAIVGLAGTNATTATGRAATVTAYAVVEETAPVARAGGPRATRGARRTAAAGAAAVALALGGCGGSPGGAVEVRQAAGPVALATVPTVVASSLPPVPMLGSGFFGNGVTAAVTKADAVISAGAGPGEIAGAPSVAFTFSVRNASGHPVGLDAVTVTAAYGSRATPASPVSGPQGSPFRGSVSSGQSASGTYVFEIPRGQRGNVTVALSYSVTEPTVVFAGSLA